LWQIDFDENLSYCDISHRSPEDLVESRTDWDDMKAYADGLDAFISALKGEIVNGTIVLA
jgi:soluble cytochrome b562